MASKPETQFAKSVWNLLEMRGNIVFPQNSHVSHKGGFYVPGTPDLLVCRKKDFAAFLLELKMENGRLQKSQKEMKARVDSIVSGRYIVLRPSDYTRILFECELI